MDGPLQRYRDLIADGTLKPDPVQALAAEKLNTLHRALKNYKPSKDRNKWLARFGFAKRADENLPHQGLYLYGGVGRGKSMLMDLLYETAPCKSMRLHFHELMRDVHDEIHTLRQMPIPDEGDPLLTIAAGLADNATLLCLDEMEVKDITHAMIVGRLFEHLFEMGVVIVTTSNRIPDDLYKDGLQRERFLPFIELIKSKLNLYELKAQEDYRLGRIRGAPVFHIPVGSDATKALDMAWESLTDGASVECEPVEFKGRKLPIDCAAHGVARASFDGLCRTPLGPADFMHISSEFETVILDDVPVMTEAEKDAARRFITLIDALYDHRTVLICSAAAPPEKLYQGAEGAFEFDRTVSRLIEMQADDYITRHHID